MKHMDIEIGEITIGHRHRKVLGDVTGLAESIKSVGLLHAVVLRSDGTLIAGRRRLAAYEALGRDTIPATVVEGSTELDAVLQAERDENLQRLDLAPSEAVGVGMAVEELAGEEARRRQHSGKSADGKAGGRGRKNLGPKLSPGFSTNGRASVVAAKAAGMSRSTYEKAKAILESGDTNLIGSDGPNRQGFRAAQGVAATASGGSTGEHSVSLPPEFRIEYCDMQGIEIGADSVDLILTDFRTTGNRCLSTACSPTGAARWLKPGGIC